MDSYSIVFACKIALFLLGLLAIVIGIVKFNLSIKMGTDKPHRVWIIAKAVTAACFLWGFLIFMNLTTGKVVESVKRNHPSSVDSITYGQVFDLIFSNMKWSELGKASYGSIVQLVADCDYGGEDRTITIRFDCGSRDFSSIKEGTPFCISFVGFDDEESTSTDVMEDLIFSMFEYYADKNQITLDESMKDGILYTDGWQGEKTEKQDDADFGEVDGIEIGEADAYEPEEDVEAQPEDQARAFSTDISFPIMYRGYADGYSVCPVMVDNETYGTYEEMMASLVDDGETLYAPPVMANRVIYTASKWDAPESEWYNGLLTYGQFLDAIAFINDVYVETGSESYYSGGSWDDISGLAGRWSGGGQEISISIYSDGSYYYAHDEVGTVSMGGESGSVYILGKGDGVVYVWCDIKGVGEWILCCRGDGKADVWNATEGSPVKEGMEFTCVEKFES